jgi:hypothetical protein
MNMTREGMIPIENKHGVLCQVQYYYDQALDDYFLVPNKRFAIADIRRVKKVMPNLVKSMILLHIVEQTSYCEPKTSIPTYAPAQNRPEYSLSEGRLNA